MIASILLKQILIMFLLMAIGFALYKFRYITEVGIKELGAVLLRIVIPCVIVKSYMVEFTVERLKELGLSALFALLSLVIAMVISYMIYGKKKRMENFAAAFCNAGFIGIPLAQAAFGDEAVFYIAAYITLLNVLQWTYGVFIMTGDATKMKPKAILTNPVLIAVVVGIVIFIGQIVIPDILSTTIGYVAGMNTPLAMIILGVYLAKVSFKEMLTDANIYICSLVRLVFIPLVTAFVISRFPVHNQMVPMVAVIAACTPVGANIAVFAQQYDRDYILAVKTVCLSTILSIISIPIVYALVQNLF